MELLRNILLIASCFLLIALAIRTGRNIKVVGMPALLSMIVFFGVWVAGNLVEVNSSDYQWMLWGRNIEQIGVFFAPLCTLYFSMDYTANRSLRKFAYVITVVQVVSVLLIFTDQYHHIMRASVMVQTGMFGKAIAVQSTKIGSVLVAFNFCLPLIAVTNLMVFARTVSKKLRRPLWLIIISVFVTFLLSAVQSTLLSSINIPIPVLNLPCVALLSYVVLRGGFVGVVPTAFNKVFEVIDQGIVVVDENGKVVEHNRRASELMDDIAYSGCLKTGSDIMELVPDRKSALNEGFSIDGLPSELKNEQRDRYISLTCHPLEAFKGKRVGYVIVLTDITLLKVRAEIDSLTGSYNREGLTSAFSDLQKHAETIPFVSAMIIDMDNFKSINDTFGHPGGDVVLRDFVSTAQALLSEKYFLGRLGGDEFVVVLPAEIEAAAAVAERLRKGVSERIVQYSNHKIQYTISVGVAACSNGECTLSELLHNADSALYKAKHEGRNLISK